MKENITVEAELVEETKFDIASIEGKVNIVSQMDSLLSKVKQEIEELNLEQLTSDVDNKAKITERRVQLNKDLKGYENDLKEIDKLINTPVVLLRSQFNTKVKPVYEEAIKLLNDKIITITDLQLKEKIEYAQTYHANKLKSVTFRKGVDYDKLPLSLNINSSLKSIRDAIDGHFKKVEDALFIIEGHNYKERLEELWVYHNYDIGKAMVELQMEITRAEKLLSDRLEREKRDREEADRKLKEYEERAWSNRQAPIVPDEPIIEEPMAEIETAQEVDSYMFRIELTENELAELIGFLYDRNISYTFEG